MNEKKIKLEPAIIWKLVTCQRITSKNTWPLWVNTRACDTAKWYWSADTLFWQLSIDHNIDVQLVFSWAPKLARKCESKHWFPCGAYGSSVARCTVLWIPNFLGWVDLLSYKAPPMHGASRRTWSSAITWWCFHLISHHNTLGILFN